MKIKRIILAVLVMVLAFALMPINAEAAKTKLSNSTISLPAGGKWQLSLDNAPKGKKVTWSSNNKKVAAVSKKGKVTAKKIGTAKVTAKVKGKKYTCTVNVIKPNASDVKALKKIIKAQNKKGAKVSSKMNSSSYTWNSKGRLTGIYWDNCKLKGSISFAGLTKLTALSCSFNQLTSLDISKNTALKQLYCDNNQLSKLNVNKNKKLDALFCGDNQLSSLDVSKNKKLEVLHCSDNQLSSLDVRKNTELQYLHCGGNQLSSLDVSNNKKLQYLSCDNNQLSKLDVSKNTKLEYLNCVGNQLSSLDLTNNKKLTELLYDDTVELIGYDK